MEIHTINDNELCNVIIDMVRDESSCEYVPMTPLRNKINRKNTLLDVGKDLNVGHPFKDKTNQREIIKEITRCGQTILNMGGGGKK